MDINIINYICMSIRFNDRFLMNFVVILHFLHENHLVKGYSVTDHKNTIKNVYHFLNYFSVLLRTSLWVFSFSKYQRTVLCNGVSKIATAYYNSRMKYQLQYNMYRFKNVLLIITPQ